MTSSKISVSVYLCLCLSVSLSVCVYVCVSVRVRRVSVRRESKLWNTKEQSGRGFNLAATSAPGHVTTALASAAPELDSTPINRLTDDKRSVVPTAQSIVRVSVRVQLSADNSRRRVHQEQRAVTP